MFRRSLLKKGPNMKQQIPEIDQLEYGLCYAEIEKKELVEI